MTYSPEYRSSIERQWSEDSAADELNDADYALWKSHRHVQRQMIGKNKALIHYRTEPDGPVILNTWKVFDSDFDLSSGMYITLRGDDALDLFTFTHVPKRLPNSTVFIWVTHFPDLQHVRQGNGKRYLDWLAVAVKFSTKAEHQAAGAEHLLDVRAFKALYPQHSNTSF